MTSVFCNSEIIFFLSAFVYFAALFIVARVFINKCLAEIGKPYGRSVFWLAFFGWNPRNSKSIEANYFPIGGMSDDDFKIIIKYRKEFRPLSFFITTIIGLILILAHPSSLCR